MNRLKNARKRIFAYITILCLIILDTLTLKAQAWIIEDMRIFVRNLCLIIFAVIVVIVIGIIWFIYGETKRKNYRKESKMVQYTYKSRI